MKIKERFPTFLYVLYLFYGHWQGTRYFICVVCESINGKYKCDVLSGEVYQEGWGPQRVDFNRGQWIREDPGHDKPDIVQGRCLLLKAPRANGATIYANRSHVTKHRQTAILGQGRYLVPSHDSKVSHYRRNREQRHLSSDFHRLHRTIKCSSRQSNFKWSI